MIRDAEARSTELNSQAEATLRAAQADAARTLHDAELAARDRLESATREAEGVLARASAQKAEADDSARRIRERVNADLTKLRQDTFEQTSLTRAEAVQLLREARNDADRVRREADEMLWKARAEVSRLAARRDNIASELGHLSGVIEALAVPVPIVQDNDTDNPDNAE